MADWSFYACTGRASLKIYGVRELRVTVCAEIGPGADRVHVYRSSRKSDEVNEYLLYEALQNNGNFKNK